MKMSFYGGNPSSYEYASKYNQDRGRTTIVVPTAVGEPTFTKLRELFVNSAGGYTLTYGEGGWHDNEGGRYASEPIARFDIAGLPMASVKRAAEMVLEAGQTDVYVELASGQVVWFNQGQEPGA